MTVEVLRFCISVCFKVSDFTSHIFHILFVLEFE